MKAPPVNHSPTGRAAATARISGSGSTRNSNRLEGLALPRIAATIGFDKVLPLVSDLVAPSQNESAGFRVAEE
jgi:hypothetical protein